MKKSQLRNIIKESIGELLNEQYVNLSAGTHTYNGCGAYAPPGMYPGADSGILHSTGNFAGQIDKCHAYEWCPNCPTGTQLLAAMPAVHALPVLHVSPTLTTDQIYQALGSPNPGQVVGFNNHPYPGGGLNPYSAIILKYLGEDPMANPMSLFAGPNDIVQLTSCTGGPTSTILGCTNPNATNYNPAATVDDGSCDFGFHCELEDALPGTPAVHSCVAGSASNPGVYPTLMDCQNSTNACSLHTLTCRKCCCEPTPGGGCIPGTEIFLSTTTTPCQCPAGMVENCDINPKLTTDPQSKMIDPEIDRMQDLANIKK